MTLSRDTAAEFARPRAASPQGALAGAGAAGLTLAGVLVMAAVSPMVLHLYDVNYELPGGTALEKIHPGSWLVFAALALRMLNAGNPLSYFAGHFARAPGVAVFLAAWLVLLEHIVLVQRVPFTPVIDSFLMPIALFLCLGDCSLRTRAGLARLLHAFMLANAALGLFEVATGFRLTPYIAVDLEIELDWRATAFLGHPLANASLTGVYCLALALGGGRDMPALLRPAAIALQLVAMVAFGGRASLVLMLVLLALIGMRGALRMSRGARVDLRLAGLVIVALPLVAAALDMAAEMGFFDRLVERFVNDRGSAKARIVMFEIVAQIPWGELILGPDPDLLANLQRREGVEYGIESFWVGFVLSYGLAASLLFFAGLAAFCREIVRATRADTLVLLAFFFGVASTSVSLSAKSTMFGLFIAIAMAMLRPREA